MKTISKLKRKLLVICATVLFMACAVFSLEGKINSSTDTSQLYDLSSQDSQLKTFLEGNVTQVANLKEQIINLEEEIEELKSVIAQQSSENEKLKKQVGNLNCVLADVEAQLEGLARSEQIALLVDRLRFTPPEQIDFP